MWEIGHLTKKGSSDSKHLNSSWFLKNTKGMFIQGKSSHLLCCELSRGMKSACVYMYYFISPSTCISPLRPWFPAITMVIGAKRQQGLGFQLFPIRRVRKTDNLTPTFQLFIPPSSVYVGQFYPTSMRSHLSQSGISPNRDGSFPT